jgi:penicillin-binding protein 1A
VEEGETAKQRPILLNTPERTDRLAPHFIEQIRRYLENTYGTYAVHEGGLRVYTTLNSAMQRAAQAAVRQGLRDYDKRHGWRGPVTNLIRDGVEDLETHRLSGWSETIQAGRLLPGIVIESADQSATVRIGNFRGVIVPDDIAWTGRSSIREVLAPGDVATFLVESVDAAAATVDLALDQVPRVEGALVAIDHATGEVKAMVGGYDFKTSQFNRAVQAERQSGSGFKPLLYTAAIEEGMRPESMINDVRVNFNGYSPSNYDNAFRGPITLRRALADSRNVPAVQVLNRIGFDRLIPLIDRFGITATIERYLPIALGATDITLIEMTSAYSTFPNGGVRIDPRLINRVTDYDGDVLEENFPQPYDVIDTETASVMVDLLQEVVRSGTATRAQSLNRPAGGKTGTTNDYTDAWFLGFTADLTAGVWIGFDEKVNLGTGETGGRAALPIWISFMEEAHKDLPVVDFEWTVAPNLSRANNQASN